jgi:hypothetical protein
VLNSGTFIVIITKNLFIKTSFPLETSISDHQMEENLTENHTTPMVAEIHIKEENSSLFTQSNLEGKKRR